MAFLFQNLGTNNMVYDNEFKHIWKDLNTIEVFSKNEWRAYGAKKV